MNHRFRKDPTNIGEKSPLGSMVRMETHVVGFRARRRARCAVLYDKSALTRKIGNWR